MRGSKAPGIQKFTPVADTQTQMRLNSREAAGFESQRIKRCPVSLFSEEGGQSQFNIPVITGRVFPPAGRPGAQSRIDGQGLFQILLPPLVLEKPPEG